MRKKKTAFFAAGRGAGLGSKVQVHVLLSAEDHALLVKLTKKLKISATDVLRKLIREA